MKLTVLGGSPAGPNTGAGCSGYLVETPRSRIVLDLGPGTLSELRRHADFRLLDGIIISHLHLDHILDVAALRFALAYNPIRPPGRLPLWLPPGGAATLDRIGGALAATSAESEFFATVFEIREYDPTTCLEIDDVVIRFHPTVHYVPCWAMRLSAPGGGADLAYTADTGPAARLEPFFAGAGVLVAEATLLDPSPEPFETRGHLTAAEAGSLAQATGVDTLVLTHAWEEFGFDNYRARAASTFQGALLIARPGLRLTW